MTSQSYVINQIDRDQKVKYYHKELKLLTFILYWVIFKGFFHTSVGDDFNEQLVWQMMANIKISCNIIES